MPEFQMVDGFPDIDQQTWSDVLVSGRNRFGLALRNFLTWSPGQYREKLGRPTDLFEGCPEAQQKAKTFQQTFQLTYQPNATSAIRYREALSYLEWLTVFQQKQSGRFNANFKQPEFHWLDAGAKNWAYVEALYRFIQANRFLNQAVDQAHEFSLDGVELDPNRRYVNLQTRRQAALAFIKTLPQAHYHAGDLLHWQKPAHVISHFLPFVFKDPHLAWGLPLDYFAPQALLNHLLSLLVPGGLVIIVNQGQAEAQAQEQLLKQAALQFPLQFESLGQLPASFIEYQYPRYGWLCIKE